MVAADISTPKSPPSSRKPVHRGGLFNVNVQQAAGEQVDLNVMREQEPDRFSQPKTQYDSDSEHSFAGQTSRRESCQTTRSRPVVGVLGASHHSNGISSNRSNSSRSRSSRGRRSAGEIMRDIVSNKAQSAGSQRLALIQTSGSEGSERKTSPDILEEITSFVGAQGDSDAEYL